MARFTVGLSLCMLITMAQPSFAQIDQAIGHTDFATGNIHLTIPVRDKAVFKFNIEVNSHLYIGNSLAGCGKTTVRLRTLSRLRDFSD